jgi:hypothetical protein
VPEAASFRVDLLASRRAGRLRAVARLLTVAAVVTCGLAALLAPSALRVGAMLASLGVLLFAFRPGRAAAGGRLTVEADGTVRAGIADADDVAVVRYCARHLVCLQTTGGLLAVWPDSLSHTQWRRLLVACRWQHRRSADGRQTLSGLRTK